MILRAKAAVQLDPLAWPSKGLSPVNLSVCVLIVLSLVVTIVETEVTVREGAEHIFATVELGLTAIFAVEYAARLWVAPESGRYGDGWRARLRYALTPASIADLIAISPVIFFFGFSDAFLLRFLRLVRILRLAHLGRISEAASDLFEAVSSRSYELIISICIAGGLLLLSATMLYFAEASLQPEAFGSIPRAMWWSIATLTTVGYGDIVPITPIGKILAAFVAITGIGLIALPAGIVAAAFSDFMQRKRQSAEHEKDR